MSTYEDYRQAAALLWGEAGDFAAAEFSRLNREHFAGSIPPMPVIIGLNVFQLQSGHRVESPQALAALQLISAFNHSPMAGLVDLRRIDVSGPGVVIVTTAQDSEITFGLKNVEQQLTRWRQIYDLGQRNDKNIASADLAVANNVPVRWAEANAAPAAPKNLNPKTPRRKNV